MKIYLHIGTEKTGSSHLQSTAAINRSRLKNEGIWFPEAGKRERQLQSGEISAGNAQDVTNTLNAGDLETCGEILANHLLKAKEKQCHSILLSNELLVLALAHESNLKKFEAILKRIGYLQTKYLLLLRDPVDQALSLYKHRAKDDAAGEIELWPQKYYYYGSGLLSFFKEAESEKIDLVTRKFNKASGSLEKILFNDWLGLNKELTPPPKMVNPSLSLSELFLLNKVRQKHPKLANILYKKFIAVSVDDKAKQTSIEQYHRDLLSNSLVQYEETWKVCNAHLPKDEQIQYPSKVENEELKRDYVSSFSTSQIDAISGIIVDSLSFRFKFQVEWLKWRRRLGLLKNKLLK